MTEQGAISLTRVDVEMEGQQAGAVGREILPGVSLEQQREPQVGTFDGAERWRVERDGESLYDIWLTSVPRGVAFEPGTERAIGPLFDGQMGDFEELARAAQGSPGLLGRWARRAVLLAEAAEAAIVPQPPPGEMLTALPEAGTFVFAQWKKRWWPAQVQSVAGDSCRVHYDGWEANWDEYVELDRLCEAPQKVEGVSVGDAISVDYRGAWYAARVLALQPDGRMRIHYDGWDASWDEDVVPARVKLGAPDATADGAVPGVPVTGELAVGTSVYIEYDGAWYGGAVLELRGELVRIHYDDWDASWDEDVSRERLRLR
jgi:hypothetical protein